MDDPNDPDPSQDPSSSLPLEWYVEQWNAVCDELGTSDPNEVMARIQTLKRQMDRPAEEDAEEEGLVTISEVEEVFREMNEKMEKLRERNATLVERLEEEGDEMEGPFRDLHQKTEQLLDTLDAATMDEARERIQKLNQRLEDLYREKEQLAQAGLSDAEEALDELERLREERDALQHERDQLQADRNRLEQQLEAAGKAEAPAASSDQPDSSIIDAATVIRDRIGVSSPDQVETLFHLVEQVYERLRSWAEGHDAVLDDEPDDALEMLHSLAAQIEALPAPDAAVDGENGIPAEAGDILGIRTVEEARELESMIGDMSEQLNRLSEEHEKLEEADLTVDAALTMIESMEEQLVDLYHGLEDSQNGTPDSAPGLDLLDDALAHRVARLTDASAEEADDLSQIVRRLTDRLETMMDEYAPLEEAGLDADEAVAMIDSMEAQLDDLYRSEDFDDGDAADRLAAIEDVLGVSTREEAEELSQLAQQMEGQLATLYEEKARLEDLGVSSIGDAVDMIESMEEQLAGLYEDKEALQNVQSGDTEQQSTFQQLEALYAEREKLQQALGVSSADDVIEMVESLNSQLDDMYEGRDAEVDPQDRAEARLWAPEPESSSSEAVSEDEDDAERDGVDPLTMNSMEHQLEALYREKETLLHHGFNSAEEVVAQLQTQQKRIDALQRENHTYEQQFDQLKSKLGTTNINQVVDLVETLESEADLSLEDVLDTTAGASEVMDYGIDLEAASPFVDEETLDRLDEMEPDELDALEVGVVRLSEDGTVEALNDTALQLPSLRSYENRSAIVGQNFFLDLAPSTNNNLFYGRFQKGQRQGVLDARFPYTFVRPDEDPQPFAVHLYRKPDGDATWLLFRPT